MVVLVVGGGAREHALVQALKRSPGVREVVAAPGNAGIARDARCAAVRADDVPGLVALAKRERAGLVVVGPEAPLVAGLADALAAEGIPTFGPGAAAARLEGSKVFAKEFMRRHGVPTAAFEIFDDADVAERYVRAAGRPLVVKADGLAAGKGVVVASETGEAVEAIDAMMRRLVFGDAGARVVVEERLGGEEVSLHVLTDGTDFVVLGAAQDHKRIGEGDTGPNTGGMGAYSPVPVYDDAVAARTLAEVVEPTIRGLRADGLAYRGVLFIGLMIEQGAPRVLEYNVRFGDPECAVLLARLSGDVLPLLEGTARGALPPGGALAQQGAALTVVMAAHGYPGTPRTGDPIDGLDRAAAVPDVAVLHAGTREQGGRLVTASGRVLAVTARGRDIDDAADKAYRAVGAIAFDGAQFRRDIGWRARRR
jgi:phosphoribosylamine--glycine ligase